MFNKLRSFTKNAASFLLLIVLVACFALWGISGTIFNLAAPYEVASVGKTDVTLNEYLVVYNQNLARMNQQTGQNLTREVAQFYGVESGARDQVLTSATLDEYARRNNIGISDEKLYTLIAENPAYQTSDGSFDAAGLARILLQSGVRESDFKRIEAGNAIRNQIMAAIGHGDILPKTYADALHKHKNEERKFAYITIGTDVLEKADEPTDEMLKTIYEEDKEKYSAPEYRKLAVLAMRPADLSKPEEISDEQLQAIYDSGEGDWKVEEKRRVEQIVLKADELDATKQKIEDGISFDELLEQNNLTKEDADLGMQEKSQLPEALREAAFSLEKNKISEVIEGQFGPTILRVVEIEEGSTKPFEEVKQQIADDLALEIAVDNILDFYNEIEDIRASGADLQTAAASVNLEVQIFNAIDSAGNDGGGERVADFPNQNELLSEAFLSEIGDQTSPLEYEEVGYIWFEVLDIIEARERTFFEVEEKVKQDWQTKNDAERIDEKVKQYKQRLEGGEELATLAEELDKQHEINFNAEPVAEGDTTSGDATSGDATSGGEKEERKKIEVAETQFLKRNGNDQNFSSNAIKEGFANNLEKKVLVADGVEGKKIIFQILETNLPAPPETLETDIENANLTAVNDMLRKFLDKLQNEYGTNFDYNLVDQALSGTLAPPGYQPPY